MFAIPSIDIEFGLGLQCARFTLLKQLKEEQICSARTQKGIKVFDTVDNKKEESTKHRIQTA